VQLLLLLRGGGLDFFVFNVHLLFQGFRLTFLPCCRQRLDTEQGTEQGKVWRSQINFKNLTTVQCTS